MAISQSVHNKWLQISALQCTTGHSRAELDRSSASPSICPMPVRLTGGDNRHISEINTGCHFTATEGVLELNVCRIFIIKHINRFLLQWLKLSAYLQNNNTLKLRFFIKLLQLWVSLTFDCLAPGGKKDTTSTSRKSNSFWAFFHKYLANYDSN